MYSSPPVGITPPTPGLEKEEPELMVAEADIPADDGTERETEAIGYPDGGGQHQHAERE
jgi:hypothetical protein